MQRARSARAAPIVGLHSKALHRHPSAYLYSCLHCFCTSQGWQDIEPGDTLGPWGSAHTAPLIVDAGDVSQHQHDIAFLRASQEHTELQRQLAQCIVDRDAERLLEVLQTQHVPIDSTVLMGNVPLLHYALLQGAMECFVGLLDCRWWMWMWLWLWWWWCRHRRRRHHWRRGCDNDIFPGGNGGGVRIVVIVKVNVVVVVTLFVTMMVVVVVMVMVVVMLVVLLLVGVVMVWFLVSG